MAYFEVFALQDSVQLLNRTVTTVGVGSAIDTTGYGSITFQITTAEAFSMTIEGSNDGTNWATQLVYPTQEFMLVDVIDDGGTFSLKTSTKYIRYNCALVMVDFAIIMIGRSGAGPNAADLISLALDSTSTTALNVNLLTGLNVDASKSLILSDGKSGSFTASVGSSIIIDTLGYQQISITTRTLAGGISSSDDGILYTTLSGMGKSTTGNLITTLTAGTSYNFPCVGRYIKITPTTAGDANYLLRNQPWNPYIYQQNLGFIAGQAVLTGGISGSLAVGGTSAVGAAITYNYLGVAGASTDNLKRRLLTDTTGRLLVTSDTTSRLNIGYNAAANTSNPLTAVGYLPATVQGTSALNVQDTTQVEGQSLAEMISLLLTEMRIMNQQLYELPYLINSGRNAQDPPETMRIDSSLFTL